MGWSGACQGGATLTVRVNQPMVCEPVFESTAPTVAHTGFFMDSQAGDFVGGGRQWLYNASNALFTVSRHSPSSGSGVSVNISGDTTWSLDLDAPAGAPLAVGTYTGAVRYPFNSFVAGLDISGNGHGCNEETGWFIVRELVIGTDGSIVRFAADVEQHCENGDPGLFAAIRYNSTIASIVPFEGAIRTAA